MPRTLTLVAVSLPAYELGVVSLCALGEERTKYLRCAL